MRALRPALTLALVALLLSAGRLPDDPPAWDLRPPAPAGPAVEPVPLDGLACAECHADVAAEWAGTLHAAAWVDPVYRKGLERKRRPQGCWGCHAPVPVHANLADRPDARETDRELGVTCTSCHLGPDGAILGPWGLATEAHASVRSETFVGAGANALCAACHRTTVGPVIGIAKGFDAGPDGARTCVGCHMRPVERVLSTGERRPGRSHALQTPRDPAFLRRAFELAVEDGLLAIRNRAGHRMPGLVDRAFRFEVTSLDADGEALARERVAVDDRAFLPERGARVVPLPGEDRPARVRVVGLHDDPRARDPVEFLDVLLDVPD